jgi:hypothetical protein
MQIHQLRQRHNVVVQIAYHPLRAGYVRHVVGVVRSKKAFARIESGYNPKAKTGSYKCLFQLREGRSLALCMASRSEPKPAKGFKFFAAGRTAHSHQMHCVDSARLSAKGQNRIR